MHINRMAATRLNRRRSKSKSIWPVTLQQQAAASEGNHTGTWQKAAKGFCSNCWIATWHLIVHCKARHGNDMAEVMRRSYACSLAGESCSFLSCAAAGLGIFARCQLPRNHPNDLRRPARVLSPFKKIEKIDAQAPGWCG